jgi:hypothetical protein
MTEAAAVIATVAATCPVQLLAGLLPDALRALLGRWPQANAGSG